MQKPDLETLTAIKEQYNLGTSAAVRLIHKRTQESELFEKVKGAAAQMPETPAERSLYPSNDTLRAVLACYHDVAWAAWLAYVDDGKEATMLNFANDTPTVREALLAGYAAAYAKLRYAGLPESAQLRGAALAMTAHLHLATLGFIHGNPRNYEAHNRLDSILADMENPLESTHSREELEDLEESGDSAYERGKNELTLHRLDFQRLYLARKAEETGFRTMQDMVENVEDDENDELWVKSREERIYLLETIRQNRGWLEKYFRS